MYMKNQDSFPLFASEKLLSLHIDWKIIVI